MQIELCKIDANRYFEAGSSSSLLICWETFLLPGKFVSTAMFSEVGEKGIIYRKHNVSKFFQKTKTRSGEIWGLGRTIEIFTFARLEWLLVGD